MTSDDQIKDLVDRFRSECAARNLTITDICSETNLSKNTVQKLLKDEARSLRSDTIHKLNAFLGKDVFASLTDAQLFRIVQSRMHVSEEFARRTIEIYSGCYLVYRLTPSADGVAVSHLEMRNLLDSGTCPYFFERVEIGEATVVDGEMPRHVFQHSGPVLYREERIYMLSIAAGNIRSMIIKAPWSRDFNSLKGLVLTVSAGREPYAARVFLQRVSRGPTTKWPVTPGTYDRTDAKVSQVVQYLDNGLLDSQSTLQIP